MKPARSIFAALLIAAAPIALSAQDAAPPEKMAVGSGAEMDPIPGWTSAQQGNATVFTAPEGDATIALLPVETAADASDAVRLAWQQFDPAFNREVRLAQDGSPRDGWDQITNISYEISPAEKLALVGVALRKGDDWTVVLVRGAQATMAKRGAQVSQAAGSLRPSGFEKETFAGKQANLMTPERMAELMGFIETTMEDVGVPGVGLALIEDGKVIYEGGLGVRDLQSGEEVDKDTRFMIASNTKGMATLLLSTLVAEGRLDWNKPVTDYYADFRLGSDATTSRTLVKHLVCACTGLPRKDMEWIFNTPPGTPARNTFVQLAATEPTTEFGETFQYNNLMASAAGFLGGHIIYPDMELGEAFDRAMDERVFEPLAMTRTTFDNALAMQGNWALPYDYDITDELVQAPMDLNYTIAPYRPAGAAWSTPHDMAKYVMNELSGGLLPNGERYIDEDALLERRKHNVKTSENAWYGMGLSDDQSNGISIIGHGGSLVGYKSNWFAIPGAGAGIVILTNSDTGGRLVGAVQRKWLEILYDGEDRAADELANGLARREEGRSKFISELITAPDEDMMAELAGRYINDDLGPLTLARKGDKWHLQSTSIGSELATRENEDGSQSLVMIAPGIFGSSVLVSQRDGGTVLVLDDGQHEYVFTRLPG